ncbi:PhzF family phenazine biosynthesis protein [uncultured Sphingomonas sp.]|uniref:PhzF family phenazine biosynthesis protein n=1 Tax=uncultured Sphingomonas sp. TaxID=158754 RepID=UPI00260E863E|nr:PhzF family phenazine biosynthesis protein [uncultured Sphingomonas sp.]
MRIPFTQVDAFADAAFGGNPAAVMPLSRWPDDATLLRIAQENNLSETAFLVPIADGEADFELRWFTPGTEVALCGHATLASGHVVLSSDTNRAAVRFATRQAGVLEVARDGAAYAMALPAWAPGLCEMPGVVAALGVEAEAVLFHEKGYVVVVVADEATVRGCAPDMRALAAQGPYVVIVTARGDATDVVSRAFVPAFAVDEDPVTGSAHAVLTPYWTQRLGRDRFTAFQASARGGRLTCTLDGDRVVLGGACVTVIEGAFLLP